MTSPWLNSRTCRGVMGENAKIKPATVIQVIRINLNQSNKIFTYQKLYLKSVHKFRQLWRVVGAAGVRKAKKQKRSLQQKEVNSINSNK